jgi:diguanylate cyclase (GGDEF)-like protein/PAS domain S-box-containing protein
MAARPNARRSRLETTGRLVIAEDEPILRAWTSDVLRRAGCEICAQVPDGPAAVREVLNHRPDLVLLDVQLAGGTDGVATACEIERRAGTPILFVTAHARRVADAPHGVRCLEKPYDERKLARAVADALAHARAPAPPPTEDAADAPGSLVPAEGVARFKSAFEHAVHGIAILGLDGAFVDANPNFAALFETTCEAFPGRALGDLLDAEPPFEAALRACLAGERDAVEACEIAVGAGYRSLSGALVRGGAGEPRFAVIHAYDVTEQRRREDELRHRALHDPLTGLANREVLHGRLQALAEAESGALERAALMMIDLDDFKAVNDRYGHAAGDRVLATVAERVRERLRREDLVARLGGDELAVLLPETSAADAVAVARALERRITSPIALGDASAGVGVSIGVTALGHGDDDPEAALARADGALYRAKTQGGGIDVDTTAGDGAAPAAAGVPDEPTPTWWLVPRLDLADGTIAAGEARLEWRPPDGGEPLDLAGIVARAERNGRTASLSAELVDGCRAVLADLAGAPGPRLVVDLAPFADPEAALAAFADGLAPTLAGRLELRLAAVVWTVGRTPDGAAAVDRLRAAGARFTVADMGVDLAQWWTLRAAPIDRVALAPHVIAELGRDARADAMLRATVELGAAFGFEVVADGVTGPRQRAHLRRCGVRRAQGPGLAAAMTPAAFRAVVAGDRRAPASTPLA